MANPKQSASLAVLMRQEDDRLTIADLQQALATERERGEKLEAELDELKTFCKRVAEILGNDPLLLPLRDRAEELGNR